MRGEEGWEGLGPVAFITTVGIGRPFEPLPEPFVNGSKRLEIELSTVGADDGLGGSEGCSLGGDRRVGACDGVAGGGACRPASASSTLTTGLAGLGWRDGARLAAGFLSRLLSAFLYRHAGMRAGAGEGGGGDGAGGGGGGGSGGRGAAAAAFAVASIGARMKSRRRLQTPFATSIRPECERRTCFILGDRGLELGSFELEARACRAVFPAGAELGHEPAICVRSWSRTSGRQTEDQVSVFLRGPVGDGPRDR